MEFLNIDLEITSRRRPAAMLGDFADRVFVLYDGKVAGGYFTAVEFSPNPMTERKVLAGFLSLLAGLSEEGKKELAKAWVKRLSFGYSITKREQFEHSFPPAVLRAVSDTGCELSVTLYEELPRRKSATSKRP